MTDISFGIRYNKKERVNMSELSIETLDEGCYCPICLAQNNPEDDYCIACHANLHMQQTSSLNTTIALLITAIILLIPANSFAMMTTTYLGEQTASTILGGVLLLWQQGSYPIAIIIFFASIVIPIGKILTLAYLCFLVETQKIHRARRANFLYRLLVFIGRWSMIDVYVVAILVAMLQWGNFMSVEPGLASLAFGAMVIVTILAAESFDPRLLWQGVNQGGYK